MSIWRSAARGAAAGLVATLAMDILLYRRHRADGGEPGFAAWEFTSSATGFDDDATPAPAKIGEGIADAVGFDVPDSSVAATSNVVHWATGAGWGSAAGLAATALPPAAAGMLTGMAAWGTSNAALGATGIYEPITSYDRETLWKDLSAHLVFGTVLGLVLSGRTLRND